MLKYSIQGNENGKLIVFINGASTGKWMWSKQLPALQEYKCLTFDLPGHGDNCTIDFTTICGCAHAIDSIIHNESQDDKAIVIGHSIGAQIILYMLEHKANCVEKAIIISGLNKPMPLVGKMIKPMIALMMPLIKMQRFARVQAKQFGIPDELFQSYYEDTLKLSKATLFNIITENTSFQYANSSNVKRDVLLLVGEKEKSIMKESAMKNRSLIRSSRAYLVKEAAHGIPYEKPEVLNNLINMFIQEKELESKGVISI